MAFRWKQFHFKTGTTICCATTNIVIIIQLHWIDILNASKFITVESNCFNEIAIFMRIDLNSRSIWMLKSFRIQINLIKTSPVIVRVETPRGRSGKWMTNMIFTIFKQSQSHLWAKVNKTMGENSFCSFTYRWWHCMWPKCVPCSLRVR